MNTISSGAVAGLGAGVASIMQEKDLDYLYGNVNQMATIVKDIVSYIETVIDGFNSKFIVESFYESGNFGQNQKQRLLELHDAIKEYGAFVCDGPDSLVNQTIEFLDSYKSLLNSGK